MTARILCVEDNPQNMRLVRKFLRREYTVLEAEDGFTGLRMAEEEEKLSNFDNSKTTAAIDTHLLPVSSSSFAECCMLRDLNFAKAFLEKRMHETKRI